MDRFWQTLCNPAPKPLFPFAANTNLTSYGGPYRVRFDKWGNVLSRTPMSLVVSSAPMSPSVQSQISSPSTGCVELPSPTSDKDEELTDIAGSEYLDDWSPSITEDQKACEEIEGLEHPSTEEKSLALSPEALNRENQRQIEQESIEDRLLLQVEQLIMNKDEMQRIYKKLVKEQSTKIKGFTFTLARRTSQRDKLKSEIVSLNKQMEKIRTEFRISEKQLQQEALQLSQSKIELSQRNKVMTEEKKSIIDILTFLETQSEEMEKAGKAREEYIEKTIDRYKQDIKKKTKYWWNLYDALHAKAAKFEEELNIKKQETAEFQKELQTSQMTAFNLSQDLSVAKSLNSQYQQQLEKMKMQYESSQKQLIDAKQQANHAAASALASLKDADGGGAPLSALSKLNLSRKRLHQD